MSSSFRKAAESQGNDSAGVADARGAKGGVDKPGLDGLLSELDDLLGVDATGFGALPCSACRHVYMCVYIHIYLSIYLSIYRSIYLVISIT